MSKSCCALHSCCGPCLHTLQHLGRYLVVAFNDCIKLSEWSRDIIEWALFPMLAGAVHLSLYSNLCNEHTLVITRTLPSSYFLSHMPPSCFYTLRIVCIILCTLFLYGACISSVCGTEYGFVAAIHFQLLRSSLSLSNCVSSNTYWLCEHIPRKTTKAYNCV